MVHLYNRDLFWYNDTGKGKPFMDYVLVLTVMCL